MLAVPATKPVENGGRSSSEDIGNGGKPATSSAMSVELADQRPITFRELDVRISWQYCNVPLHSGSDV